MESDNLEDAFIVNKMLCVAKNGKLGYQSAVTGDMITEYNYEDAKYFMDGYAPVKKDGKWGFIDENGNEVTDFIFDDASMLYHGKTYVSVDGVYGILDLVTTLNDGAEITEETINVDAGTVEKVANEISEMMIPIGMVTVHVNNLNVRRSPTIKADLAAEKHSIPEGSVFDVYATAKADGYTWYQIDDNMWIANDGTWVTYTEY